MASTVNNPIVIDLGKAIFSISPQISNEAIVGLHGLLGFTELHMNMQWAATMRVDIDKNLRVEMTADSDDSVYDAIRTILNVVGMEMCYSVEDELVANDSIKFVLNYENILLSGGLGPRAVFGDRVSRAVTGILNIPSGDWARDCCKKSIHLRTTQTMLLWV